MIRNIFILILIGFMAGCQGKAKNEDKQTHTNPDPDKLGIVVINVQGMTCTGCEKTIAKNVTSLGGISRCEVSHITGITKVEFDSTLTTIRKITDAIEKSGYQVGDVISVHDKSKNIN